MSGCWRRTTPTTASGVSYIAERAPKWPLPDHLIPIGRTAGLPMNGAVSNLAVFPETVGALGRELRSGRYDLVHVHEPNAPYASWFATESARVPTVATFHTYSLERTRGTLHRQRRGSAPALLEAERPHRGVRGRALDRAALLRRPLPDRSERGRSGRGAPELRAPHDELRILFVGRAEARKGLPVLLRAFEALRGAGIRARLIVAGATEAEVEPLLLERDGVEVAGRVDDDEKWRLLGEADLLCAPSLGGETSGWCSPRRSRRARP